MPTIQVTYNGRPISGERVHISWSGGGTTSGRTDSQGVFRFPETGYGKIYVEGSNEVKFDGKIEGTISVYKSY